MTEYLGKMVYEAGALEVNLAVAAGGDPALLAELREAFADGVRRQVDLLERARCDANWVMAAMRLKGLAASFHSDRLLTLADNALDLAPGEPTVVRDIKAYILEFERI